jgi:hypothetical protein
VCVCVCECSGGCLSLNKISPVIHHVINSRAGSVYDAVTIGPWADVHVLFSLHQLANITNGRGAVLHRKVHLE